jgi:poly-gamma-glutamate capsule biosynthesis protein CapA/YwtB (metallophosphatase superfamily)
MQYTGRNIFRVVLALIILLTLPLTQVEAAQRSDGLDAPLYTANFCGSGSPGETQFTFAATGDTFPHLNIQRVGESLGYDYLFDRVRPYLKAADLAYTNFDGAMLESAPLSEYPSFNFSPKLGEALKKAGITLFSTANNHILDKGPAGLDATIEVLNRLGIMQHGTKPGVESGKPHQPYLPVQVTRNGVTLKIGFISATWGTNGIPDPYRQVNLLYTTSDYGQVGQVRKEILDAVAQAKRENDIVIVAAHWGVEYEFYPRESQTAAARKLANAGADIIVGAQSHTLQPVDVLDTQGRKTLVVYSLANFIAAQGWAQAEKFSNTSVIFYAGIVKGADGKARVTGYRYLPTIIENDTRPIPAPDTGQERVIEHVRTIMRDFNGQKQISPDPAGLKEGVAICRTLTFPEVPGRSIGGDFAEYFATLSEGSTRPVRESIAIVGFPLGPVVQEKTGDCSRETAVLYTERQRLELQPAAGWPFRVVGTQLGTEVYRQKYGLKGEISRLAEKDIANARFQNFYQRYGGLVVFGYPISRELSEVDVETGKQKMVQYFERARFELEKGATENPDPLYKVQLGLLGKEYAGIAQQCSANTGGGVKTKPGSPLRIEAKLDFPALSDTNSVPSTLSNQVQEQIASENQPEGGSNVGPLYIVIAVLLLAGIWLAQGRFKLKRPAARNITEHNQLR